MYHPVIGAAGWYIIRNFLDYINKKMFFCSIYINL